MKIKDLLESNTYRPLSEIARDIKKDWKNPGYAKPYIDALSEIDKITDKYYADDARSVVLYLLSNAASWRGETAKRIKAELKAMLDNKPVKESLIIEGEVDSILECITEALEKLKKSSAYTKDAKDIFTKIHAALRRFLMRDDIDGFKGAWNEMSSKYPDHFDEFAEESFSVAGLDPHHSTFEEFMKANLSESFITEGINFAVMQQKIFDYVLKKMKELNPTMHSSYAAELARATDQFFTTAFDKCHEAFNKAEDRSEIEDELGVTIEEVSNVIVDFFADEMNHPTGYAARKLVGIDRDTPSQKDIDDLIKKIDPNLARELENRS